jgi:hypothetical protein
MNSVAHAEHRPPADPLCVFFERTNTLGYLFAEGDLLLGEFLDAIGDAAIQFRKAVAQELPLSRSFARACKLADKQVGARPDPEPIPIVATHGVPSAGRLQAEYERRIERQRERYGPAPATLKATNYLDDPKQLETFLLAHPAAERAAIVAYIQKQRGQS